MPPRYRYNIGDRFGHLTLIRRLPGKVWVLRCDCEKQIQIPSKNVAYGHTTSCGCQKLKGLKDRRQRLLREARDRKGEVINGRQLLIYKGNGVYKVVCVICKRQSRSRPATLEARPCRCAAITGDNTLEGKVVGSWQVLTLKPYQRGKPLDRWACRCVCGRRRTVVGRHLRQGRSLSCGCQRRVPTGEKSL